MAIFSYLERYRYLRSTYLFVLAGGASKTRFQERLGDLFHEGYLLRPEQQWQTADARSQPAIHEIAGKGECISRAHGYPAGVRATFLGTRAHRQFAHSVMICECLASIELATRENPNLRFVPWGEILARAPEHVRSDPIPFRFASPTGAVVPDGLFGIEYRDTDGGTKYRFFALEVDRGTMPVTRTSQYQTSYAAKLGAYQKIISDKFYSTWLGLPNLFVLTITTSDARCRQMAQVVAQHCERLLFLFKPIGENALRTPTPSLLTDPWIQVGHGLFSLV